MTALDGLGAAFARCDPAHCPWMPDLAAEARDIRRREQWSYDAGYSDGFEAGYAAAHAEMASWWAQLARRIRADAHRAPHAERRAAELERAKPRPGDFTGRLTPEQYLAGRVGTPGRAA